MSLRPDKDTIQFPTWKGPIFERIACAVEVYNMTTRYQWVDGRQLFPAAVSICLETISPMRVVFNFLITLTSKHDQLHVFSELLDNMREAAHVSLRGSLTNFGAPTGLNWLGELLRIVVDNPALSLHPFFQSSIIPKLSPLLAVLHESVEAGLITTEGARRNLERLQRHVNNWEDWQRRNAPTPPPPRTQTEHSYHGKSLVGPYASAEPLFKCISELIDAYRITDSP